MRKSLCLLLVLILLVIVALPSCGSPAKTSSPDPTATTAPDVSASSASKTVTFSDPVLESLVRASIGMPSGDITAADTAAVSRLDLSVALQSYSSGKDAEVIQNIDGLQFFTSLEYLDLSGHAIGDITPLAGLTKLSTLILTGNPVSDIAPLSGLTSLRLLDLTGCAAPDYALLTELEDLEYLNLTKSTIADATPIAALANLKYLFIEGSSIGDFFPLSDIYPKLLQKDFISATTLAELGFYMDHNNKLAILDGEEASVRLNHREWGDPPDSWMGNCIRIITEQNGYKIDIGYYPEHDAYVAMAFKNDQVFNFVYDLRNNGVDVSPAEREDLEEAVHTVFPDATDEDILFAPARIHRELLAKTVGLSLESLYKMPFDPNDHTLPTAFTRLGFTFLDYKGAYYYEEKVPHELNLYIHRSDFDAVVSPENILDWNMQFYDDDVNGYTLQLFYYEADDRYHATLEKDGVQASVSIRPATGEPGDTSPDPDTAREFFNDAFGTEGDNYNKAALWYFEQVLQDRFGRGAEELYGMAE